MKRAIYPGTFDPITNGHLDIIDRAIHIFDEVIVAVTVNSKKTPLFSLDERKEMIETQIQKRGYRQVTVEALAGQLTIDYAIEKKAISIVRGLRQVSDFEFEFQIALMNRHISEKVSKDVSTVFLMPNEKYIYLSSSLIREVARLGGDIHDFVPEEVILKISEKFKK